MIPNILTTVRLIIIPIFAYSFFSAKSLMLPALLFLLSGITDVVDGWIARRFKMITDVGRVYDPLVDKLMQLTTVVCLAVKDIVPIWVICVIAVKELVMITVGSILYIKNIVVSSNWYGKAATVFFYAVIFLLIVLPDINTGYKMMLLSAMVAVFVMAAIGYFVKFIENKDKKIFHCKEDKV